MPPTKLATCCYCGSKTALQLRGEKRHELACGRCGAPLSKMKMLPTDGGHTSAGGTATARPGTDHRVFTREAMRVKRPKKSSKKKSLKRRVLSEVWDVIEDIFD